MKKYFLLTTFDLLTFTSRNRSNKSDNNDVADLTTGYLEESPPCETDKFNTNKQRLDDSSDQEPIEAIQGLTDEGFIEINDERVHRKWFSKGSVHIITLTLTKEALPYLVKQNKNNAEVRTIICKFNDKKVTLEKSIENVSVHTVILNEERTSFYYFDKGPYPNISFITQKFKLKYSKKTGWKIIKK